MSGHSITIVSGSAARKGVSHADAIALMREAFISLDAGQSLNFAGARGHGSDPGTRFGAKPGYDAINRVPGLKIGSYWQNNAAHGLLNHGSTTILLDDATGFPTAIVEASWLNGLRTAASDAVGVEALSRPDSRVLAIIGTGNQAWHDAKAISLVRPIEQVLIAGRNRESAKTLAEKLQADGIAAEPSDIAGALAQADIVVTATPSRAKLFDAADIRPGTHISAMGADGPGKQELPVELAARAQLFADEPGQSLVIGEFQYLAGTPDAERITAIGAVLRGTAEGRASADSTTIYDSSGIGLQDLVIASFALSQARAAGIAQEVEF